MTSLAIARIYQHSFSNHPNFTLAITGGSLNALGDCLAQLSQNAVRIRSFPRASMEYILKVIKADKKRARRSEAL